MPRSNALRLRRAFAEILATCLATTTAVGVVNCGAGAVAAPSPDGGTTTDGGTHPDGGPTPDAGPTTPGYASLCGAYSTPLLKGLRASPQVDYAAHRYETAFTNWAVEPDAGDAGVDDAWKATTIDSTGTLCATAKDQAACTNAANDFRVLPKDQTACMGKYGGQVGCSVAYILYTRQDEVGAAVTVAEVQKLVGTIDNIDEALLVAGEHGYSPACAADGSRNAKLPQSEYRATSDGGFDLRLLKTPDCAPIKDCYIHVDADGNVTEQSCADLTESSACAGRRPEGFAGTPLGSNADAGAYFAHMAELEAASVTAFERLHRDLSELGAPSALLERIHTAACDEVRHTRAMTALAGRYGATPRAPRIDEPHERPTFFSLARENAREGCVRETFGALVAHVQAMRSPDPLVRASMKTIAEEETEHAALSWDIATWLESHLDAEQRLALKAEREATIAALADALRAPTPNDTRSVAGLPATDEALSLLASLAPTLLAA